MRSSWILVAKELESVSVFESEPSACVASEFPKLLASIAMLVNRDAAPKLRIPSACLGPCLGRRQSRRRFGKRWSQRRSR